MMACDIVCKFKVGLPAILKEALEIMQAHQLLAPRCMGS